MNYDENLIIEELKKHLTGLDVSIDFNEVLASVEIVDGFTVFNMLGDGFVFIGNTLIDVMPGWKSGGIKR